MSWCVDCCTITSIHTHTHIYVYALIRLISHLWVITSILSFSPLFVCSCVFFWRRYLVLCNKKWRTAGAQRGVQFSQSGLIGMNHSSLNLSSASLGRVHHDPGLYTGRWREIRQSVVICSMIFAERPPAYENRNDLFPYFECRLNYTSQTQP